MSSTAGVLKKNRGKILVAIAALLIALVAVVGSGAYFTSVSTNPGNMFTAGVLTHDNSAGDGNFFMTLSDIVPDDAVVHTGTVTITNTGSVDGDLFLSETAFADVVGWGGAGSPLSATLQVTVKDEGGAVVWGPGLIGTMGLNNAVGTVAAGDDQTYTWEIVFPDNDAPGGAMLGDNAYQGAEVTVDYAWELVSQ
jgi:predicted ribosomally synthesized peptide with SipW-like signal peptide